MHTRHRKQTKYSDYKKTSALKIMHPYALSYIKFDTRISADTQIIVQTKVLRVLIHCALVMRIIIFLCVGYIMPSSCDNDLSS